MHGQNHIKPIQIFTCFARLSEETVSMSLCSISLLLSITGLGVCLPHGENWVLLKGLNQ